MWLLGQIVLYLLAAFLIGAFGSWVYRGRLADDSQERLRQRFREMVSRAEMERDAAKLRVRELTRQVRALEDGREGAEAVKKPKGRPLERPQATAPSLTVLTADAVEDLLAEAPPEGIPATAVDVADLAPSVVPDSSVPDPLPDPPEPATQDPPMAPIAVPVGTNGAAPASDVAPATVESTGIDTSPSPHPLSDLGEIPPEISKRLRALGVNNTAELCQYFKSGPEPGALASVLGVESRKVRRWKVLSDLLEVPELRPQDAWLLEISGLASAAELADEHPEELAARMAGLNEDQDLGLPVPEPERVASWVRWAAELAGRSMTRR